MDIDHLERIYSRIPKLSCARKCTRICTTGPLRFGKLEYRRIVERVGYEPKGDTTNWVCPLLKDGLCTVYDIRPAICRLWGCTAAMACEHGCKPEKWLSAEQTRKILNEVYSAGISYEMWSEADYRAARRQIGRTMDFTVRERITLLNILPAEGDLTTLKLMRQAREALSFDDAEHATLQFKQEGGRLFWDASNEKDKEIKLPAKVVGMIQDQLSDLNKKKKLTEEHLTLCEKFEVE